MHALKLLKLINLHAYYQNVSDMRFVYTSRLCFLNDIFRESMYFAIIFFLDLKKAPKRSAIFSGMKGPVFDIHKSSTFYCVLAGTRAATLKENLGQLLLSTLASFDIIKAPTREISFSCYSFAT